MKCVETAGGIPVFLNNFEYKVYESIIEETCTEDLSERDVELARQLCNKNILTREEKDGKTYYSRKKGSL
jgi:hypothetical protein